MDDRDRHIERLLRERKRQIADDSAARRRVAALVANAPERDAEVA